MNQNELPTIATSAYGSTTSSHSLADMVAGVGAQGINFATLQQQQFDALNQAHLKAQLVPPPKTNPTEIEMADKDQRRLVQVFIADPDENVPLADCLLYSGEQKLTDLTDQELFFEIDIRTVLENHNKKRTALINKNLKSRVEHLEPARIRDLKMTVVTIASF